MRDMVMQQINTYTMKMRLYPSAAQKQQMETIFRALHIAYNITFHEVFQLNPAVCGKPNKSGAIWPDFNKMAQKEWRQELIARNPAVAAAPAASLTTNGGLFRKDAKKAWDSGMKNSPVLPERRKEFRFYHAGYPRRSFYVQMMAKNLCPAPDNEKVAWITLPLVGRMKARGFNRRLRFGENGCHDFAEAVQAGEVAKQLSATVSKDTCGDYFVSIVFSAGKQDEHPPFLLLPAAEEPPQPVGIDVGVKDVAILSTGQKVANRHFKNRHRETLTRLNRALSRRWGPANMAYRDYNKAIRRENRSQPDAPPTPLAEPGRRYLATQRKKALLERRIARQRDAYYHQRTAKLVRQSSLIAIESLQVANMMRNHKLAYALADAAMSDFLAKLRYKADRVGTPVKCTGAFAPTSQLCSSCGAQYPAAKNLSIRTWTCPVCGIHHDRDVNAAKNILRLVLEGGTQAAPEPEAPEPKRPPPGRRKRNPMQVFPDEPEVVVAFSRELTRLNDPRYVIKHTATGKILDDAQGAGYRSAANARNCYKAKVRFATDPDFPPRKQHI